MGSAAFFIAIASIISPLCTCKYDFAIFSPKTDVDSAKFFFGSVIINLFFSLSVILIILLSSFLFSYHFMLYVITVVLAFLNGLDFSFTAWFNRNKEYKYITVGRILRILFLNASIILFGLWEANSFNIIVSNIIGLFVFNIFLLVIFIKRYPDISNGISFKNIIALLKDNIEYPRYSMPASIVNILSAQSPVIILKILFGESIAGIYALVNRAMGAPSQLISGATGEVYRQKASSDYNEQGNCYKLFLKTFKGLFLISTIPFIIVIIFGPDLFSLVFGLEWIESGYFARYLAIFFLLRFCISPLSFTLIIANRQNYNLHWQLFLFINTTLAIMAGYILNNYMVSVISFSLVYSIMYAFYFNEIRLSARGNLVHEKD